MVNDWGKAQQVKHMDVFLFYTSSASADLRLESRGNISPVVVSHIQKSVFSDSKKSSTFLLGLTFFLSTFWEFFSNVQTCYWRYFHDFIAFLFYLFISRPNFAQSTIPVLWILDEICWYYIGCWQLCYFLLLSFLYHVFQFVKQCKKTQFKTFNWKTWCFTPPWWCFL